MECRWTDRSLTLRSMRAASPHQGDHDFDLYSHSTGHLETECAEGYGNRGYKQRGAVELVANLGPTGSTHFAGGTVGVHCAAITRGRSSFSSSFAPRALHRETVVSSPHLSF